MVINFVCRKSKISKRDGLCPLELYVIIDGKRKFISLDRKIDYKLFNAKKQVVKDDNQTNEYISAIRLKCYSIETEMIKHGQLLNVDTFVHAFKYGIKSSEISVFSLFDEFMERQVEKHTKGLNSGAAVSKYKCTVKYSKEALGCDKMLAKLSQSDIEKIHLYMLGKMANNSAIGYMKKLKSILLFAVQEGYCNSVPFVFKFHKDKVETEPLTLEEIRTIRTKEFSSPRLNNVRDLFILQCYTGLAYHDMSTLTRKDIKQDKDGKEWIVKDRMKTNVTAYIPILPIVKEILEKHQYILPTLSNQKYNTYLKEIQDVCGIEKTLHSHLARHTCGTILLNAGVDLMTVSRILGHSTTKTTEAVYVKLLPSTIMERVEKVSDKII